MEFFRIHKTIPFMRFSHILNAISFISFAVAVYWIFAHGLAFSIEFTGGTQVVVNYPQAVSAEEVRGQIQQGLKVEAAVQNYGTARDLMIRLPMKAGESSGQQAQELMKVLSVKEPGVKLLNNEYVGPQVGEELATDGATALLLVVIGIMIYLAFRFEWKFAVAAIIANRKTMTANARAETVADCRRPVLPDFARTRETATRVSRSRIVFISADCAQARRTMLNSSHFKYSNGPKTTMNSIEKNS